MASVQGDAKPNISSILSSLNLAQLEAVEHSPTVPLQILAGPGSGKTKVLISRIAYLILHHAIPPASICAVTFTNKAANEMRERLTKIIGKEYTSQIKMGTFHALCALFLRKYAHTVGLERNFTVCDAGESKKLISNILKPYKDQLVAQDITLKEAVVVSMISRAKARGQVAADMRKESGTRTTAVASPAEQINAIVAEIYSDYEKTLREANSLDFDDLLLFGVKLFQGHSKSVDWCKHILVDEFQDTNVTQYELMHALAACKCITVVGDPDQSIYGWRSAEVGNLSRMQKDYPGTQRIFLEENYRSAGAILDASVAIVSQDKSRVQKSLFTSHPRGTSPTLFSVVSEQDEATRIAQEIKRVTAYMGGIVSYSDFAILLRFTALSRTIESTLQKEGIPNRILGGHKFFERLEIKDILAYLQLVDNPDYNPAFTRVVNIPSRGIGDKALEEIIKRAQNKKLSMLAVVEKICDNRLPDVKPSIKRKLNDFVNIIHSLKALVSKGISPADLIQQLLVRVDYENHLKKTQSDWEARWENIQELITFAGEASVDTADSIATGEDRSQESSTPLRSFLQASMLSSEGDKQSEADTEKVTITTCHAAKGLEWPIVFVPAVENETFPFYRTEDVEEERRLLYVACTRAQCLLYLSYAEKRKVASETKTRVMSPFLSTVKSMNQTLFRDTIPVFDFSDCQTISHMLSRPEPDKEQVQRQIAEYEQKYSLCDTDQPNWSLQPLLTPGISLAQSNDGYQPDPPPTFISSGLVLNQNHGVLAAYRSNSSIHAPSAAVATPLDTYNGPSIEMLSSHPHPSSVSIRPPARVVVPLARHPAQNSENSMQQTAAPQLTQSMPSNSGEGQRVPLVPIVTAGTKRRLGMGRSTIGYMNKKFKAPT